MGAYEDVRALMQPGDVIAFGGNNPISDIIKRSAGTSQVSHIGLIQQAAPAGGAPVLIESTVRFEPPEANGVTSSDLDVVRAGYDGQMWWLPLGAGPRATTFDAAHYQAFLASVQYSMYDLFGGISVVAAGFIRLLIHQNIIRGHEELRFLFCSELVADALEAAAMAPGVRGSETSPADICEWAIYEPAYTQIKGVQQGLGPYNAQAPGTRRSGGKQHRLQILRRLAELADQQGVAQAKPLISAIDAALQGLAAIAGHY